MQGHSVVLKWDDTTRKEVIGPPQKYWDKNDSVLVLALALGNLCSGSFDVDGKVHGPFSIGW